LATSDFRSGEMVLARARSPRRPSDTAAEFFPLFLWRRIAVRLLRGGDVYNRLGELVGSLDV
jgi:hypothetical protein